MEGFFFISLSFNNWSAKSREERNNRAQWNVYGKAYLKKNTQKPLKLLSQTRLFHRLANAKSEGSLIPKVLHRGQSRKEISSKVSAQSGLCNWKKNTFNLMDFCKWRGRPMMVYLRGLCEFPVRWLDSGPYPFSLCLYSCYFVTVGSPPHTPLSSPSKITNQEVECTGWIQSCDVYSSYPRKGWKRPICSG